MLIAAWKPRLVRSLVVVDASPDVSADGLAEMRRIGTRPLRRFVSSRTAAQTFRLIPPETVARPARLRALAEHSTRHLGNGRWTVGPDREFLSRFVPQVAWYLLRRIVSPTLILRSERSSILSRSTAETMRRTLPHAILVEVPNTYHHLIVERPAWVARVIRDFLTGIHLEFENGSTPPRKSVQDD
jgi:pimeloyl-ACP methyl ester carboxylesterase